MAHWKNVDTTFLPLFNPIWGIVIDGIPIINDIQEKIISTVHRPNIFKYWKSHKLPTLCPNAVNWEALGITASNSIISRKLWNVKNASDWLPTNKNPKKWGMLDTSKCPFCNSVEDSLHVQRCLATTTSNNRKKVLQSLPKKLERLKTAPHIKVAILKILAKTWKEIPVSKYGLDTKSVLNMESAQEEVGSPENIITGKWCFKWQQEQERFF